MVEWNEIDYFITNDMRIARDTARYDKFSFPSDHRPVQIK